MSNTSLWLPLCPGLPLLAAILCAVFGPRWLKEGCRWLAVFGIGGALASAALLTTDLVREIAARDSGDGRVGYERIVTLWNWALVDDAYDGSRWEPTTGGGEAATSGRPTSSIPFRADIALRLDSLTAIMLVTVNLVALLVAIYAAGYMHGDRGYWRFFAYFSLFVFAMNTLVTASNFLLVFVAWEGVGVCSYLLIGFWYERPAAAAAGKKAFLVNRVGDFGFMLALFMIFLTYGSLNFHDTEGQPGVLGMQRLAENAYVGGGIGLAICLLLMLGACGKSAQLPLHVWLADAMEGPTPVSALIHAATMVTAGVYLVARCSPLFMASPEAQLVVACIGGATALMAGVIAMTQHDLKRILAYSTLSQLGYMFLGLGVGTSAGIVAGMFHLFTHAFFKALLFLGAGSVMHAMGNVIDIRKFGGLRHRMPWTHATFLIGCLALSGVAPLAGFWSKDAILGSVRDQAVALAVVKRESATKTASGLALGDVPIHLVATEATTEHEGGAHGEYAVSTTHLAHWSPALRETAGVLYRLLYYVGLATALLTAIYTFRAFYLTFYGEEEIPPEAGHHAHESPRIMTVPLIVLAACSVVVGWWMYSGDRFGGFLEQTPSLAVSSVVATRALHLSHADVALYSTLIALFGIGVASYVFLGPKSEAESLKRFFSRPYGGLLYPLSHGKFFFDEIYDAMIVKPLRGLGLAASLADRWWVDGLVDLVGMAPIWVGGFARRWQRSLVSRHGLAMMLGLLAILGIRWWWGGSP